MRACILNWQCASFGLGVICSAGRAEEEIDRLENVEGGESCDKKPARRKLDGKVPEQGRFTKRNKGGIFNFSPSARIKCFLYHEMKQRRRCWLVAGWYDEVSMDDGYYK